MLGHYTQPMLNVGVKKGGISCSFKQYIPDEVLDKRYKYRSISSNPNFNRLEMIILILISLCFGTFG